MNCNGYIIVNFKAVGAQDAWSRAVGIERDKEHFYKYLNIVRTLLEEHVETRNFSEP